jgi:hypothetical protein
VTVTLLLDPGLLVPPSVPISEWQAYWSSLVKWSTDGRVKLGRASHDFAYNEYAKVGYPHARLDVHPPELSREYRKALDRLLASVLPAEPRSEPVTLSSEYLGTADAERALLRDIPVAAAALATTVEHWAEDVAQLRCAPPPPETMQLVFAPGDDLQDEQTGEARLWFSGRKVRIVGGQPDARVVKQIEEELQVRPGDIEWLPCERHKKPAMKKRWGGLDPANDVAVCVTGRVGHSTWEAARRCANASGVPYLEVETANGIVDGLIDLSASSSASVVQEADRHEGAT